MKIISVQVGVRGSRYNSILTPLLPCFRFPFAQSTQPEADEQQVCALVPAHLKFALVLICVRCLVCVTAGLGPSWRDEKYPSAHQVNCWDIQCDIRIFRAE